MCCGFDGDVSGACGEELMTGYTMFCISYCWKDVCRLRFYQISKWQPLKDAWILVKLGEWENEGDYVDDRKDFKAKCTGS